MVEKETSLQKIQRLTSGQENIRNVATSAHIHHGKTAFTDNLLAAAGMMALFYTLFLMSGIKVNFRNLAIYGVLLDLIFRKLMIFGSLKGYYEYFNYFWSAVWGIIPLCLPLAINILFI